MATAFIKYGIFIVHHGKRFKLLRSLINLLSSFMLNDFKLRGIFETSVILKKYNNNCD